MCGIAGLIKFNSEEPISEGLIRSMCDRIIHRGPDDSGYVTGKGFGLGSRRLAILDLSPLGHMPMSSDDGRYHIVYNGEVYNYRTIREDLEERGIVFKSHSDTEVVLQSFIQFGSSGFHRLNGMFAFAIFDSVENKTIIVRDRLGIKPLFYYSDTQQFCFASEIKALFAGGISKEFDNSCFEELICFRYVAGERTVYKNIKRLLPGCFLEIDHRKGSVTKQIWWDLKDAVQRKKHEFLKDPASWYRQIFDDSVSLRTISDVPIGVLLSGGLDSTSVASSLAAQNQKVSSFTVRFREQNFDEGDLAKIAAEKNNLEYNELFIDPSTLFAKTIEANKFNDEPLFHSSDLFVLEISRFAKKKVTVLLSGEGGDETLGGYIRYRPLWYPLALKVGTFFSPLIRLLPLKGRLKKLIRFIGVGNLEKMVLYNSCENLPKELEALGFKSTEEFEYREKVLVDAKQLYPKDYFRQAMFCDMHTYLCSLLDRNDRMTMGASIECRVPFLDYRIIERLFSLEKNQLLSRSKAKKLLRDALGYRLPKEILNARKWGFGIPWNKYYREDQNFRTYIKNLANHKLVSQNFNSTGPISKTIDSFLEGNDNNYPIVNQLFNICFWYDLNFGKVPGVAV